MQTPATRETNKSWGVGDYELLVMLLQCGCWACPINHKERMTQDGTTVLQWLWQGAEIEVIKGYRPQ
jgi:hypothetical protein